MKTDRLIILFTAILGGSDTLKPAPLGADECVCFTDDFSIPHPGWLLLPAHGTGAPRPRAWQLRCRPHVLFPEADVTVWVDASMLVTNLRGLLADAGQADLAAMHHPERRSYLEEAEELVTVGKATRAGIDRQLAAYQDTGFKPQALTSANVLVRRHTPRVRAFNEAWAQELLTFPDDNAQLSLDYCAWLTGTPIHYVKGSYVANPYSVFDIADHHARWKPYR